MWWARGAALPSSVAWDGSAPADGHVYLGEQRRRPTTWHWRKDPHLLLTGAPGAGVSESLAVVTAQWISASGQVVVCDPRCGDASGDDEHSTGVDGLREALRSVHEQVRRRDGETSGSPRAALLLVIDGADACLATESEDTRAGRRRNSAREETRTLLRAVLEQGPGVGVHVAIAVRDVEGLSRHIGLGCLAVRVAVGEVGPAERSMLFGSSRVEVAQYMPGRALVGGIGRSPSVAQLAHLPRPHAPASMSSPVRGAVGAVLLAAQRGAADEEEVGLALTALSEARRGAGAALPR